MAEIFTPKQLALGLEGVDVSRAVVALQVIDRAFDRGVIQGIEASVVSDARKTLVEAVQKTTRIHYDEARRKQAEELMLAQQAAAQAPQTAPVASVANNDAGEKKTARRSK